MARKRTVKPGFFTNEELAELSRDVRLFFAGLWVIADREGRLENRPKRIKRDVFPYDADVTEDVVEQWLDRLATCKGKFVRLYVVDGEKYIEIKNFKKHQDIHPREAPSEIPGQPKANLGLPKANPVPEISGSDQPNPGSAQKLNEIIPLPSCPSCTSRSLSSTHALEASDPDPDRARDPSSMGDGPGAKPKRPSGYDLLVLFGNLRREILKLQGAPGTERPKDINGKAGLFAEQLTADEVCDVEKTMRLVLERIRDGVLGWTDPRIVDPSFAFGAWKNGFPGLREALHNCAPAPRAPPAKAKTAIPSALDMLDELERERAERKAAQ